MQGLWPYLLLQPDLLHCLHPHNWPNLQQVELGIQSTLAMVPSCVQSPVQSSFDGLDTLGTVAETFKQVSAK